MFIYKNIFILPLCIILLSEKGIAEPCVCCSLWSEIHYLKNGESGIDTIGKLSEDLHAVPVDSLSIYGVSIKERSRDTIEKYIDTALSLLHQASHYDLCSCNSMNRDSFFYIMEILPHGEVVHYSCENRKFFVSPGDIHKFSSLRNIYPKIPYNISCLVYVDVFKKDNFINRTKIKKIEFVNPSRNMMQFGHCFLPIEWLITRSTQLFIDKNTDYRFLIRVGIDDQGIMRIIKDDFIDDEDSITYNHIRRQLLDSRFNKIYRPLEILQAEFLFRLKKTKSSIQKSH